MTEKRFTFGGTYEEPVIRDNITGKEYPTEENSLMELLNELNEENNEIKQLIYTMLVQMDIEKIKTENTRYSARIIFTFEEFKKMRQIWKGDVE